LLHYTQDLDLVIKTPFKVDAFVFKVDAVVFKVDAFVFKVDAFVFNIAIITNKNINFLYKI
jgi:hypothetical protein